MLSDYGLCNNDKEVSGPILKEKAIIIHSELQDASTLLEVMDGYHAGKASWSSFH